MPSLVDPRVFWLQADPDVEQGENLPVPFPRLCFAISQDTATKVLREASGGGTDQPLLVRLGVHNRRHAQPPARTPSGPQDPTFLVLCRLCFLSWCALTRVQQSSVGRDVSSRWQQSAPGSQLCLALLCATQAGAQLPASGTQECRCAQLLPASLGVDLVPVVRDALLPVTFRPP